MPLPAPDGAGGVRGGAGSKGLADGARGAPLFRRQDEG